MKERLLQLLDLEQLSPSKFAEIIGVQRSSVSHVISGRNNPSYDFLQRTLKAFPGLNAAWLITGKGTMYEQMGRNVTGNLFESVTDHPESIGDHPESIGDHPESIEDHPESIKDHSEPPDAEESARISQEPEEIPDAHAKSESFTRKTEHGGERGRKVVRVLIIFDDDTFSTYEPAQ